MTRLTRLPRLGDEIFSFAAWSEGLQCFRLADNDKPMRRVYFDRKLIDPDPPPGISGLIEMLFELDEDRQKIGKKIARCERIPPQPPVNYSAFIKNLRTWASEIPPSCRRIASGLPNKMQYAALEAMRYTEGFTEFLEQEENTRGLWFALIVWQFAHVELRPFAERLALSRRMLHTMRPQLLESLSDAECRPALLRHLQRLPIAEIDEDAFWMLRDVLAHPQGAAALASLNKLNIHALRALHELPSWIFSVGLARTIGMSITKDVPLQAVIPPALLNADPEFRPAISISLSGSDNVNNLELRLHRWSQKLFLETPFPPPPYTGSNHMRPLLNAGMLKREGLRMKNCVAGYAENVTARQAYFYHWSGSQEATVQIDRWGKTARWCFVEALSVENEELPSTEIKAIIQALADIAGDEGLFVERSMIVGGEHYDFDKARPEFVDGMPLTLRHEADNPHDPNAIEVLLRRWKLGYVRRCQNAQCARFFDLGLMLCGRLIRSGSVWDVEVFVCGSNSDV